MRNCASEDALRRRTLGVRAEGRHTVITAIGVIAALLQQAGRHELTLCVRHPLAALTVETPDGPVHVEATIATDPAAVSAVDWVIVATKAYDAAGAWRLLRSPVRERLAAAAAALPEGLRLRFVEGFRPPELQARYFAGYRDRLRAERPALTEAEAQEGLGVLSAVLEELDRDLRA